MKRDKLTEGIAAMRIEYRSGEAMSIRTNQTTTLLQIKTVATTLAERLKDGRAQNRLYANAICATLRPLQYARKTERRQNAELSLHYGRGTTVTTHFVINDPFCNMDPFCNKSRPIL